MHPFKATALATFVATAVLGSGTSALARAAAPPAFEYVGTFDVRENAGSKVAEIVTVSQNGRTLIYTDSDAELIGFVDIDDPSRPEADGVVPVGGEPTSVAVTRRYALVAVNTSTTT